MTAMACLFFLVKGWAWLSARSGDVVRWQHRLLEEQCRHCAGEAAVWLFLFWLWLAESWRDCQAAASALCARLVVVRSFCSFCGHCRHCRRCGFSCSLTLRCLAFSSFALSCLVGGRLVSSFSLRFLHSWLCLLHKLRLTHALIREENGGNCCSTRTLCLFRAFLRFRFLCGSFRSGTFLSYTFRCCSLLGITCSRSCSLNSFLH